MAHEREVIVCQNQEEIFHRSADLFVQLAQESIAANGRFSVALSGGSTPKGMFELLASDVYRERIDWQNIHMFWGDERSVPPTDAQSNYRMANEAMISKIAIPAANVYRMQAEAADIEAAARAYEDSLKSYFNLADGAQPNFDLILLGMGDDGHTASLFPGTTALQEKDRIVVVNWVEKFNTNRMTLTAPAINNARNVVFMAAGANKTAPLKEVLAGERNPTLYPSQLIAPTNGKLIWLIDVAAAGDQKF